MEKNGSGTKVKVVKKVMSNRDLLGDAVPVDQQHALRRVCYDLLNLKMDFRLHPDSQFPATQPVLLNRFFNSLPEYIEYGRENLQLMRQSYYCVTWKPDGTRYMMLITSGACYLIDTKFNFRKVQLQFPCRQKNKETERTHHFTLLDGEMIIQIDRDTGKQQRIYLFNDLMAFNGESVIELPFNQRWGMIHDEVIVPRQMKMCAKGIDYELETFYVSRMEFWKLQNVPKVLKTFLPVVPTPTAGLIFQGWDDPYRPRTHERLLKWEYPLVDFRIEMGVDNLPLLFLFESGRKKLMGANRVVSGDAFDPSFESGKVLECFWDPKGKIWVCIQTRLYKTTPIGRNTFEKVVSSIKDKMNEVALLDQIGEIVRLPMYVNNDSKVHQQRSKRSSSLLQDLR